MILLSGCEKQTIQKAPADEPAVRTPTATEVFNLRSKCNELGEKILHDNVLSAIVIGGPRRFHLQVSHYNPKTNRCYVELDISDGDLLTGPTGGTDYFLYDGQTGQLLAFAKNDHGTKTGFGSNSVTPAGSPYDEALEKIHNLMDDDRKQ